MQQVIVVMGTDGSGKTTLTSDLVASLRGEGIDVVREWLGAESYLMAPVRRILRRTWAGRSGIGNKTSGDKRPTYREEVSRKNELVTRHAWATSGYLTLVMADYRMQLQYKLFRSRQHEIVIADRYVFDVVVNLALTLGWTIEEAIQYTQKQIGRFPAVRLGVYVKVSPEVSMSRKDDIPDIEYIRLRQTYYEAIARAFGFTVIDGTVPIAENVSKLRDLVQDNFVTPSIHYVHSNNEDVGGADMVLVSMAEHMGRSGAGYRTMVHLRLPTSIAQKHAALGTPVALSNYVRPQLTGGAAGLVRLVVLGPVALCHFWRIFDRQRPDLVHVNDLYDFIPALAARMHRIPVVFHIRMIKTGVIQEVFSTLVPRLANVSVSVSAAVRDNYRFKNDHPEENLVIHDLGNRRLVDYQGDVRLPGPPPAELPVRGRIVTMVGRFERWKGQHLFLEAIERLPDELRNRNSFVLVGGRVPGKEAYADSIEREADRLGAQCLGVRDDVPEILLASDISVHCSVAPDPFPGVVVESLLAGAVTVAARAGGVVEIINDESQGVTYAPGDSEELSELIASLLTASEAPRARYAKVGRARALELTSANVIDGQLASVYEKLTRPLPDRVKSGRGAL